MVSSFAWPRNARNQHDTFVTTLQGAEGSWSTALAVMRDGRILQVAVLETTSTRTRAPASAAPLPAPADELILN
jgi:hypothetical protein